LLSAESHLGLGVAGTQFARSATLGTNQTVRAKLTLPRSCCGLNMPIVKKWSVI
jgi:hypothetical protein